MDLMPDRMGFFAHENSVISELEADHKMDKKLKIADNAAPTGLSPSTISRVLAGKAKPSARAREQLLAGAREVGVREGMAAGRPLVKNRKVYVPE
ncbi:cytochrome-c peroxidase, partial [Escherichia coli]